jgi:hypothetical protein
LVWIEPGTLGLNWVYVDRAAVEHAQRVLRARLDWTSSAETEQLVVQASPSEVNGALGDLGPLQVELFDEAGRPIASQVTTNEQAYVFDFGVLPAGRYRFEVTNAGGAGSQVAVGDAHGAWPLGGRWMCHGELGAAEPDAEGGDAEGGWAESEGVCSPARSSELILPVRLVTGSDPLFRPR